MSPDLLQEVGQALREGRGIRRRLMPWGRLHLDRPLPFLLVYRRPPGGHDPGTARLLQGEAAYLLVEGDPACAGEVEGLLRAVVEPLRLRFGTVLVLELWADAPADPHAGPGFHLYAPREDPPQRLLEVLESELLAIRLRGRCARVALDYHDGIAPPGLAPLWDAVGARELGVIPLGLAVRPVYRDPGGERLYPFVLAHLHRHLSQALRHVFFVFAHDYTPKRPVHIHQLGPGALTREVRRVDRALGVIASEFDLLLHVTPVNAVEAWGRFRDSGFQHPPRFLYRPRDADPGLLKRRLFQIPLEEVDDPALWHIFQSKRDELDRQITLYADRGTARFLAGSRALFGEVDAELARLARALAERLAGMGGDGGKPLPVAEVVARAEAELARYREQDPAFSARVELREDVTGILVSRGNFLVGADARVSEARLAPALAHEIGTHCLTYHNGARQPLDELRVGMAGYEPLQEGLAVVAEYLVGGLGPGRLFQLAARVLAVEAVLGGADFIETFRLLRRYGQGERAAFTTAMRVFRGGGYTKDVVYLRGLVALLDYLGRGGDLELLYVGKVSLEFLDLVEELRWREVLIPPVLRPHHLENAEARARLERLRAGMDVLRLAEEVAS